MDFKTYLIEEDQLQIKLPDSIYDVHGFRRLVKKVTGQRIKDKDAFWFATYQEAIRMGDLSTKDIARTLLDGIKPMNTAQAFDEWIQSWGFDEPEEMEQLVDMIKEFYH